VTFGQAGPDGSALELADVVPGARRIHPRDLQRGDRIFDATGETLRIKQVELLGRGAVVRVVCENMGQRWFVADEPITAIVDRPRPPTIRARADVLDPDDDIGWALGEPAILET
jgi:hypothetical protein